MDILLPLKSKKVPANELPWVNKKNLKASFMIVSQLLAEETLLTSATYVIVWTTTESPAGPNTTQPK